MRFVLGLVTAAAAVWLSSGAFRAAQADTALTCRIPNARPPAFLSPSPGTRGTPRDGDEPRVLLSWERRSQSNGDWSWLADVDYAPARNELVYLDAPNIIVARDLSSNRRRTLLTLDASQTVRHLVVSHAGDRLAFSAGRDYFPDIYVMGMTGASPTRLTDSIGDFEKGGRSYYYTYSLPKFSPDDRMLLFQILHGPDPNNRIALVGVSGGPVRTLGEGYTEAAYWSADGTRVCTNSDARTAKKIVYDVASGRATVGAVGSSDRHPDASCRVIADTASIDTCEVPRRYSVWRGDAVSQRWVRPDIVINFHELESPGRPGYRIEVLRFLN